MASDRADADRWERRAACNDHPALPPLTWDVDRELEYSPTGRMDRARKREQLSRLATAVSVCEHECPVMEQCHAQARLEKTDGVIRAGRAWGTNAHTLNSDIRRFRTLKIADQVA